MVKNYLLDNDSHIIHCSLCKRSLKTYAVHRDEWDSDDRCYYDRIIYEAEDAVLRKNWICLDCDKNFSDIVKKKIERSGKDYIKGLKNRLEEIEKEFNKKVYEERTKTSLVERLTEKVSNVDKLSDLDEKTVEGLLELNGKPFNCYFLQPAIDKEIKEERERLEGVRKFFRDWAIQYGFTLSEQGKRKELVLMPLKDFYAMTEDSCWFNIKFSEWSEKRSMIENDLNALRSKVE